MKHYAVLFVCMGNICRSPTAEGVFLHKVQQHGLQEVVTVDSAGTHNYHPNSPPDPRTQEHASLRGYDLSALRARKIKTSDFEAFDLILAMDWDNLALIQDICPEQHLKKVRRMTEFCLTLESPVVPDPYYDGPSPASMQQRLAVFENAALDDAIQKRHIVPAVMTLCCTAELH